ncbi:hypothetical protein SEA_PAITO_66 [Mycobacterium phage Paito]|uniref:Uncharacterized protein n=1 Tax=Mycobacterium phage Paito TaxID=2315544 RepID=A0A386KH57_9CAUD|nr:hypothetical protein KDW68_gp66 [Mycobacterium phage Paito]AYD84650.1 hypothetical protein SEA_PAITO_66 [Mycobacterium phage Paito]
MTVVLIAATLTRAQQIAEQAGITKPVTMSPYSMRHHGAGRGIVADLVLVDDSALPLDSHALEMVELMRAGRP